MVSFFKNSNYIIYLLTSLVASFWLIINVFLITVKGNPIEITNEVDTRVFNFIPQGWAFFTRDPREAQITIYKIENDSILKPYPQRHSSFTNLFGLKRTSSKILTELQLLKLKTSDSLYSNLKWNYQANQYSKIPSEKFEYRNEIFDPILLGDFIVVYQKPVPWAWSKSIERIEMPSKIIRFKIHK